MDKIIEYLNKQTNNKYQNLLFFGAVYNKDLGTMQMQFQSDVENYKKYKENVGEIEVLCKQFFANKISDIRVSIKANAVTMQSLKECIINSAKCQNLMGANINELKIDFVDDKTYVTIPCQVGSINSEQSNFAKEQIEDEVLEKIGYKIIVEFMELETETSSILNSRRDRLIEDTSIVEDMKKSEVVTLQNVESIYGDFSQTTAYISGHFGDEIEMCIVGNVKSCNIRETKPKNPDDEKSTKKYMSFELEYDGSITKFIWFFPKSFEAAEFEEGSTIAVFGKKEVFNDKINIRVKSIAKCTFIPPKKVWRKCPTEYRYIKPEPYEHSEQINFFVEYKKTDNKYLLNNTFVVYDLETTGTFPEVDSIIDIGAYKLVEGRIVEKFCTFVNPECEIPPHATKINHITNEMVENSPTIEMVLPDFYKFCQNSILVGYNNIGFDDLFIKKEGKKQLLNFDNESNDVYRIAYDNIKGLHNYKLGTVCAHENVPLIDAHRAANDALATAKLFVKLVEKYY